MTRDELKARLRAGKWAQHSRVLVGDVRRVLKRLPAESVQTVVTGPPYWRLRDYKAKGQLGLEDTPDDYVANLVDVFEDVWNVLKPDGTVWLNLGDSYNSARPVKSKVWTLKPKDLVGIPWLVAFALRESGWYLRSDIVWEKGNPMPESVTDRPTKSHEYVFLLTKLPHSYYYDADAIREPLSQNLETRARNNRADKSTVGADGMKGKRFGQSGVGTGYKDGDRAQATSRNKRSVWTVNTVQYRENHFAVFPPKLIEPCVLAGAREGDVVLDPFCGSGTTLAVAKQHRRRGIGIELNPDYAELAYERVLDVPWVKKLFKS